jgi:hypothetical protein
VKKEDGEATEGEAMGTGAETLLDRSDRTFNLANVTISGHDIEM